MNEVIEKKKFDWKIALDERKDVFKTALPPTVDVDQFIAVCKRAVSTVPNLMDCIATSPSVAFNAFLDCAADGLMPDNRQAALVVFRNRRNETWDLTYIPMVRGIIDRLHNTGLIKDIKVRMVFSGDEFEYITGDEEKITHKPAGNIGEATHVYAIVNMKDGGVYRDVMTAKEIMVLKNMAIRKVGGADKAWRTPWGGEFEFEMWKKTVLHRLKKIMPMSAQDRTMIERNDDLYTFDGADEPQEAPILRPLNIMGSEDEIERQTA